MKRKQRTKSKPEAKAAMRNNFVSKQPEKEFKAKSEAKQIPPKGQALNSQRDVKDADAGQLAKSVGLDLKRLGQVARELEDRVKARRHNPQDIELRTNKDSLKASASMTKTQSRNESSSSKKNAQKTDRAEFDHSLSKNSPGRQNSGRFSTHLRPKHSAIPRDQHNPNQYIHDFVHRYQRQFS